MLDIALAFAAGVLTVGAPCVLPVLPVLFGASVGRTSRWRPLFIAAGFVVAFAGLAITLSLFPTLLGLSPNTIRGAAIVLLLVFGLLMIWPRPLDWVTARLGGLFGRAHAIGAKAGPGHLGGFVLGMTLAVVWTPCAGPVLGSILTLIATQEDVARSSLLIAVYALGSAVPMALIAYGGQAASTSARSLARYARPAQLVFGVVTVAVALAIYFEYDTQVVAWLSQFYPNGKVGL
ncbi:cytochrome c biogenesis CcdA family protein [Methylopila musalis]|uniref:Cytochrome c biogenesis CcdA family protein n=1 Tax=Methylopila musalis TaxID=1134781 RepID=A0ABW3Z4P1_9HYPH